MAEQEIEFAKHGERLAKAESTINYFHRYMQMSALTSAYQNFQTRNLVLERDIQERLRSEERPIRVCYFVYILDQVCYPIISAFHSDPRFDLKLIAQEPDQVDFLRSRGYKAGLIHSKWEQFPDYSEAAKQPFKADICFSEMPYGILPSLSLAIRPWMISGGWLPEYSAIFPHYELQNALFCMIHYAYFLADEWLWLRSNPDLNVHYGLPYPNFCWLYFLESDSHLEFALDRNSFGNTANYVVSGYPKYDVYLQEPKKPDSFSWTYPASQRKRIIYAPHFKRSDGTLRQTCESLLRLADTGRYEIIFKPHPVHNTTVNEFIPRFAQQPSCQTVRHSDSSQYIFATSDVAIISSVSMHADGLFSGKPYISELDEQNFNHIGKGVRAAAYDMTTETDLENLLEDILSRGIDPKKDARDLIRQKLATPGKSATDTILKTIADRLLVS